MSPQSEVMPGAKTGPVWSPCPLRYSFASESTLDVSTVIVEYGLFVAPVLWQRVTLIDVGVGLGEPEVGVGLAEVSVGVAVGDGDA